MTDKDPKDMTASELLRWAATLDKDCYGQDAPQARLLSALSGKEYYLADYRDYAAALLLVADKIDAELAKARKSGFDDFKLADWYYSADANGWPKPRDDESLHEYVDRCFIPRPRFEDGEPVQSSDIEEIGALATCRVYMDGSWEFDPDKYEDERNPKPWDVQSGAKSDRIKRPAPEVLGADGLPIKVGDAMWSLSGAGPLTVTSLHTDDPTPDGGDSPWADLDDDGLYSWIYAGSLTHTPPDTLERLRDDIAEWRADCARPGSGWDVKTAEWADRIDAIIRRTGGAE